MMRRIIATGLAAATLFAAVPGVAAPAQAPAPDPAPAPEPITAPATTADTAPSNEGLATPPAATPTPTPTPTPAPATTAPATAPAPAPAQPKAAATPKAAAATPQAPAASDAPTSTQEPVKSKGADKPKPKATKPRKPRPANSNAGNGKTGKTGKGGKDSGSTSTRGHAKPRDKTHKAPAPVAPSAPTVPAPPLTHRDGTPAPTNPGYSLATPGPARVGVPNFFIDKFRIPPFLLPIYQAAGTQYGVRWEVLAAINEIETDYGRNLNISSAGAVGWMQFMPATWKMYGVDANGDGVKDPFNPVDAIFAAARYLRAAGADHDIRRAVFAYNHADWYVDSVLMRAQVIGGLPSDLVGSLTGLTQGRFPVHARATYAGQLTKKGNKVKTGNAAMVVESDGARRGIEIFSREGAPIIAVNDGRVVKIGHNKRLGRFVMLQDVYGNTYAYAHLGTVAKTYPAPKSRSKRGKRKARKVVQAPRATTPAMPVKERLFAHPNRPAARAAGAHVPAPTPKDPLTQDAPLGFKARDFEPKPLKKGVRVIGGTIIGHLGERTAGTAPHLLFKIRPAGRGAPRIDPKPILDGWKLLESTAIYRAKGKNPFFGADAENLSVGRLLLLSKEQLIQRVLHDERIQIYGCGISDIRSGQIDRRILATMLYLAAQGLKPTISSLKCGHGYLTSSGNVSEHSTGTAMDIAAINGIVIRPSTQGPGSITDVTIRALLKLQGTMKPHQIISLMTFQGADNTLSMGDHDDHIHVGFRPQYGENRRAARQIDAVLKPGQWIKLIDRLGSIDNPTIRAQPSRFAVKVHKHRGD